MEHTWLGGPSDGEIIHTSQCGLTVATPRSFIDVINYKGDSTDAIEIKTEAWRCEISRNGKHYLVKSDSKLVDPASIK